MKSNNIVRKASAARFVGQLLFLFSDIAIQSVQIPRDSWPVSCALSIWFSDCGSDLLELDGELQVIGSTMSTYKYHLQTDLLFVRQYCPPVVNVFRVSEIDEIISNLEMNNARTLHRTPYGSFSLAILFNLILDAFLRLSTCRNFKFVANWLLAMWWEDCTPAQCTLDANQILWLFSAMKLH